MKINSSTLYKFSGISIIIAGLLFAIIQIIHPSNDLLSIKSDAWMLAHILTFIFPIFGILGITGIYLKQFQKAGLVGLIGYLALLTAFILMTCFAFYEAFIVPDLVDQAPGYVESALSILNGENGPRYISAIYSLNGVFYLIGGLIFGLSVFRAKVFSRLSGLMIIFSVIVTLMAAILPQLARPSGVLFGLSLVYLGIMQIKINQVTS